VHNFHQLLRLPIIGGAQFWNRQQPISNRGYSPQQCIADSDTHMPPKAAPSTKSTTAKQDRGENKREGEDVKAKKARRSCG
jgi:hypothetical protein